MEGEELGLLDGSGTGDEGGAGGDESFVLEEGAEEGAEGGGEGGGAGAEEGGEGGGEEGGERSAIVKFTPDAVKKGIREIVTANPDFAKKFPQLEKTIARALYKDSQITQLGGLAKINELAEAIEVYGGVEGLAEMSEDLSAYRELEQGFERGDPKVVEGWGNDFPSGLKKLILPAFGKVEAIDASYADAVFSHLASNKFEKHGVFATFVTLGEAIEGLKADDPKRAEAIRLFNSVAKFLGDMKALAPKAKIGRDDRDEELDNREKTINEKNYKIFYGSVRQDVNTAIMSEMNRLIRLNLPAGKKVKIETANRLRKEINAELARQLHSKTSFQEKYDAVLHGGNKERAVRFIVSNARQALPAVVKQLLKEFNLVGSGGAGGAGGAGGGARRVADNGASRVIAGRPKTSEIDFTRTDKSMWLRTMGTHGTAWLLNGKQAKW